MDFLIRTRTNIHNSTLKNKKQTKSRFWEATFKVRGFEYDAKPTIENLCVRTRNKLRNVTKNCDEKNQEFDTSYFGISPKYYKKKAMVARIFIYGKLGQSYHEISHGKYHVSK